MGKFVPRQRKHKHRVREEEERQKAAAKIGIQAGGDANADVILPPAKAEKEEKRAKLREELRSQQPQSKISKKKQKRLDKYIVRSWKWRHIGCTARGFSKIILGSWRLRYMIQANLSSRNRIISSRRKKTSIL